jgi:hypothetical protein
MAIQTYRRRVMPTGVYIRTKPVWNKGKVGCYSKKTLYLMSIARLGKSPANKGKEGLRRENNGHWKGGKYINQGYVYILTPEHPFCKKNGYVAEHRLVIEKEIGRYITKKESIHHKNKKRNDNRKENLMLLRDKITHNRIDRGLPIDSINIIFNN